MRIQHNIMAMNAYRNYNTNTSALSKNLEKLSSGYKINRAGDDAAGLAISEKMRAQITGLNAAQKNVKDGVSLVKTAEGAMQEIQDMLNRMDYLATQSANGTYDNDTDRANLQKEVEQLKTEINRIADSANFNGIKLLNGSLDANATGVGATQASEGTVTTLVTSTKGAALGTNTVEHQDGTQAAKTKFSVALHEVKFANNAGEGITISLGGAANTITIKGGADGAAGTEMDAKAIVDYLTQHSNETDTDKLEFGGNISAGAAAGKIVIDNETFSISAGADGTSLVFEQDSVTAKHIDGDMDVTVSGGEKAAVKAGWKTGVYTAGKTGATTGTDGDDDTISDSTAKITLTIDGTDVDFDAANIDSKSTIDQMVTALGGAAGTVDGNAKVATDYLTVKKNDDGSISFEVKDGLKKADGTDLTVTVKAFTFTAGTATAGADGNMGDQTAAPVMTDGAKVNAAAGENPVSGDYNMKTTVTTKGQDAGASRIASGVVTLAAKDFADGTIIKIGNKEYTVTTDKANRSNANPEGTGDYIYVGDLDLTADLQKAIDRLTVKAESNEVWTVGQGATTGTVTFVEKVNDQGKSYTEQNTVDGKLTDGKFDLTKEAVIKETFGIVTGKTTADAGKAGSSLVLQIGDTSDAFNQMKVNIGSMKTTEMGLDFTMTTKDGVTVYNKGTQGPDAIAAGTKKSEQTIAEIDISTRDGASEAINTIKNAINYVSGVRGDLGALQNRLEHTGNNLSVMAENIQDAESTIRDTDIAEEMMSYTKNNILVQSAQAMLAQANQVPQGVLQLLG